MLTYKKDSSGRFTSVYLDKKHIGYILKVQDGYRYKAKASGVGDHTGEVFPTIDEVKQSLEAE